MDKLRIGLIGLGVMGRQHAETIIIGKIPRAKLTAVCDVDRDCLKRFEDQYGRGIKQFNNTDAFFDSGLFDGVIVATYHFDHPPLAIRALNKGLHVLIEKPAGVYTKQVRQMNEVAVSSGKVFAIMFNQRTYPLHKKLKDIIKSGELGPIKRTNYVVTDWYRSQSYYDAGGWRGTWDGEGGGVLLNQCPHQLDLWQWMCGMPSRVRAFCSFGKYHEIDVEDEVTAYVEYPDGATGVFIATTGETPGTNRMEIAGDRGKIVMEDKKLTFWQTEVSERQFNRTFKGHFGAPEYSKQEIFAEKHVGEHGIVILNWVDAILDQTPLIAKGEEGINSLELSNAMLFSTWQNDWVSLPVDEDLFYRKLQEKISNFPKTKLSD